MIKEPSDRIRMQNRCASALLSEAAGRPVDYACLPRGSGGKPFVPGDPDFHFNISHSGGYLALCTSRQSEVGIDLQEIRPLSAGLEKITRRFYSPSEYAYLQKITDPAEKELTFFRLWSVKEAYLKYKGTGLRGDPASVSAHIPPGGLAGAVRIRLDSDPAVLCTFPAPPAPDYVLALCHPAGTSDLSLRMSRI